MRNVRHLADLSTRQDQLELGNFTKREKVIIRPVFNRPLSNYDVSVYGGGSGGNNIMCEVEVEMISRNASWLGWT